MFSLTVKQKVISFTLLCLVLVSAVVLVALTSHSSSRVSAQNGGRGEPPPPSTEIPGERAPGDEGTVSVNCVLRGHEYICDFNYTDVVSTILFPTNSTHCYGLVYWQGYGPLKQRGYILKYSLYPMRWHDIPVKPGGTIFAYVNYYYAPKNNAGERLTVETSCNNLGPDADNYWVGVDKNWGVALNTDDEPQTVDNYYSDTISFEAPEIGDPANIPIPPEPVSHLDITGLIWEPTPGAAITLSWEGPVRRDDVGVAQNETETIGERNIQYFIEWRDYSHGFNHYHKKNVIEAVDPNVDTDSEIVAGGRPGEETTIVENLINERHWVRMWAEQTTTDGTILKGPVYQISGISGGIATQ